MEANNWKLIERNYKKDVQLNETLFNLANGYLGIRGNFEESVPNAVPSVRGAYINAFYESEEISYGEKLFGFPDRSQSIVNVIDAQTIYLEINNERFSLYQGEVLDYKRTLDFKAGVATRKIYWRSPKGNEVKISIKRIASFEKRELFLINYEVEAVNFNGTVKIISTLNGDVSNIVAEDDPRVGTANAKSLEVADIYTDGQNSYITDVTKHTKFKVVCGISHKVKGDLTEEAEYFEKSIIHTFTGNIKKGSKITFTKYAVYTDTRRHEKEIEQNQKILNQLLEHDFDYFENSQKNYLEKFWENSDIIIEGEEKLQQGIRFNMFHLLQSVGKDKYSNIAAKGLSGEGYEGHYFWDTEIYIFPFFLFTNPELAKNLLNYRYSILDAARKRAREMGHPIGALYPWRTIAGDECSPFFPAGTAQYHINTDVAYSIIQYFEVTDDIDYMAEKGLEALIEIARLMYHTGHFRSDGKFCIDAVTGPDEYSCIVNNNYYTNLLTKHLFHHTIKIWNTVKEWKEESVEVLKAKIEFSEKELTGFEKAGVSMYLPFDESLQIHLQDDSFLNKKPWDFKNTPKENYPLLLNYHPLTLYRHQVCKQADTVLAHFLLENGVDLEVIRNDYNYYEKITTHDSSLSTCIFSIMASRIGQHEKAYDYFMTTARLDIDNLHHNTKDGIHTACMGGSWMSTIFGFAGMRIHNGELSFRPHLPGKWNRLSFKINFKDRKIQCEITPSGSQFTLVKGEPLSIKVNNETTDIF